MSNELATITSPLTDKMEYAKALAHSNLLPEQYRGNPANLLYALEYADALGVAPINAITSIHVIKGKPTASADLIAGLVRKAGHKLRISGDDTFALAQIIRHDDPDFTYEARWDIPKARAAGLASATWKAYPAAMLRARAITEVARMGASDALFGCIYTPEEVGAQVDGDGTPVGQSASPMQRLQAVTAPEPEADPETGEVIEGEIVAEPEPDDTPPPHKATAVGLRTEEQSKRMFAQFTELGIKDRAEYSAYIEGALGHSVESSKLLTRAECGQVMDQQQADINARKLVDQELGIEASE